MDVPHSLLNKAVASVALITLALFTLALAGCDEAAAPEAEQSIIATDPLLARALSDPLMVDPDMAYRNEVNAAVTIRYDHPLPPLVVNAELANQARNAAWVELLEDGQIAELPIASRDAGRTDFSGMSDAASMVGAVGGPRNCAAKLTAGLSWAAKLPEPAAIMPHGMIQKAAGFEGGECALRVVRYLTPVGIEDALQYHFTRADRARLRPAYYEGPQRMVIGDGLTGSGRSRKLIVQARPGPGGLSVVDLIYWAQ